jgi:hypothetical protein
MERSLKGTHPCLAKYSHLKDDNVWGSFERRFKTYRVDRDIAEATLERIKDEEELAYLPQPARRDFEQPIQYFRNLAGLKGEVFVIEQLNFVIANRLYGEPVDAEDSDIPYAPLSEKALRSKGRRAERKAKREKKGQAKPYQPPKAGEVRRRAEAKAKGNR